MDTYALERSWKPCSRSSFSGSCPAATSFLSTKHQKTCIMKKYIRMMAYIMCTFLVLRISRHGICGLISTYINLQKLLILFLMYCTAVLNFSKIIYLNQTTRIMKNLYFNQHKVMPYKQATHYHTCNISKKKMLNI